MPKRFLRLFFAVFLALTALFAGTIYVVDPYYHYHGPVAGLPLWLQDGRYQNVGAAENLDYDYLLMGTSVTANFTLEPFQQRLPGQTRKLIVQGGYFEDFLLPLDVALETHTVRQVFWGVDSNCWRRYDKENTWEAPTYLFDENLYNDVHYLLSKDTFFWYIPDILADWCVQAKSLPPFSNSARMGLKNAAEKINTIILGNLSSKVNRLTKKEQDPAEPCRFRQDLGIVIGAAWWPP